MDERELIQVNLQLPSDALDKLSALVEQFRRLTAAVNGLKTSAGMTEETAESGFFEPERFQAWVDAQGVRASGAVTLLVRGSYSIL